MTTRANYANESAADTEVAFDSLYHETKGGVALDSANGGGAVDSFIKSSTERMPASLKSTMDFFDSKLDGKAGKLIVDSVLQGMRAHEKRHGVLPTADVIEAALDQVKAYGMSAKELLLDGVGSTAAHDPQSAMPENIQIGLLTAIAEAFPAATYLPTGIGSNQAILGIVSHLSASNTGDYTQGGSLDGINIGGTFFSSERRAAVALATDRLSGTAGLSLTKGGAANVKLLRNRTIVYVNGFPVAYENSNSNAATVNSPISGNVILKGESYAITGGVNLGTGAVVLNFAPALPAGTKVTVEGFINYEIDPSVTPKVMTQVQTYNLYAVPWRGLLTQTIDSKTQYQNEIGMDLQGESLLAARNQVTVERHRSILRKALELAAVNVEDFDFDYTNQMSQKTRAQIWSDLPAVLGIVDQKMAELTMDRGVTHLYVGKLVKAQFENLPSDLFAPSGLTAIPGIYRLGKLFGRFEVYYTPWELVEDEAAGTSQILCLGRSNSPARNSFVMGDAVPVTVLPTSFGQDMNYGQALYARNFTSVNPHQASACGAALINVTGLFKAA
ncbi:MULTISPECIES: hypothetical protein [Pseudomonas]|uniref:Major capsid protein n=1 Tax=Pseudomonas lutea TaxID=243924 RepID=A0A9X8QLN7_9PSED|nr:MULTISPECIES: hypothetical protein [Pseudomonas]SER35437.1 hypothetical protein SAMN05216409_11811 [Pseudomonas lutea]